MALDKRSVLEQLKIPQHGIGQRSENTIELSITGMGVYFEMAFACYFRLSVISRRSGVFEGLYRVKFLSVIFPYCSEKLLIFVSNYN